MDSRPEMSNVRLDGIAIFAYDDRIYFKPFIKPGMTLIDIARQVFKVTLDAFRDTWHASRDLEELLEGIPDSDVVLHLWDSDNDVWFVRKWEDVEGDNELWKCIVNYHMGERGTKRKFELYDEEDEEYELVASIRRLKIEDIPSRTGVEDHETRLITSFRGLEIEDVPPMGMDDHKLVVSFRRLEIEDVPPWAVTSPVRWDPVRWTPRRRM